VTKPSPNSSAPDRTTPPPFNKNFSFQLVEPAIHSLPSGLPIFVLRGGQQEIIKLELILDAGRWREPAPGHSYFAAHLIQKGTRKKSSLEIATAIEQLGAHLEAEPGNDYVALSLHTLASKFERALDLLVEILIEPVFPQRELDHLKATYLQTLAVNNEKTSYVASRLFRKALFGEAHPYGREVTEPDVEKIQRERLEEYHQKQFKSHALFASGYLTDADVTKINDHFAALDFGQSSDLLRVATSESRRILEARTTSLQTSIRVGRRTIHRSHEDFPLLLLLNHVLGGFFGSRLMKNIREEKGLTYGIHSSVYALAHDAYLVIGSDVIKESREVAFEEIMKEMGRLRNEPINEEELDQARFHFLGSLASDLSTIFAHAEKAKTRFLDNLPSEYYSRLIHTIRNAQPDQLMEMACKHFPEEGWIEVAVG
jgi:predicted Zn-dependent peptidase